MAIGSHVPLMPGMSHREAERKAVEIVRTFRPDLLAKAQPFPAAEFFEYHLVERYGLNTGTADLPFGIEGVTRPDGTIRIAAHVYDAMLDELDGRSRFTPVHEGVHGIVHLKTLQMLKVELVEKTGAGPPLYRREEVPAYADPEWQANRVAGAIIMPYHAMRALVERYGLSTQALVTEFRVSRGAADTRIGHLLRLGWIDWKREGAPR